jgi:hypothetical protein
MRKLAKHNSLFFLLLCGLYGTNCFSQISKTNLSQDQKIEQLLKEKRKINQSIATNELYKIQIFYGNSDDSKKKLQEFKKQFKDIDATADCVISTNTLHHLHDPIVFWECVKRAAPQVFVMDLVRPKSTAIARHIVDTLAKDESNEFKFDYYNSLIAAFSIDELTEQITQTESELL